MNLETAYSDPAQLSDSVVDRYYDLLPAPSNRGAMLERSRQRVLEDSLPLLRQIHVTALLLWGKKDRLISYANSVEYMSALKNATLVSFAKLGHVPHEQAPQNRCSPYAHFWHL